VTVSRRHLALIGFGTFVLALAALFLYSYRVDVFEGLVGFFALRWVARRAGIVSPRRRARSSFASNVKALALLYAAWNTRWLRPTASAPRARAFSRAVGTVDTPEGPLAAGPAGVHDPSGSFGELPEGY
jgi:hypothetical protein